MALWGVVLMTVTFASGGVAYYGDVNTDTFQGWYETPEMCADAAVERNNSSYSWQDWWVGSPRFYFECKRKPNESKSNG
jgi:hypothetical protein